MYIIYIHFLIQLTLRISIRITIIKFTPDETKNFKKYTLLININ